MIDAQRMQKAVEKALVYAVRFGGIDGAHQAWVIDQMVRALLDCPMVEETIECDAGPYTFERQGESASYLKLVAEACDGEDGPETYEWNEGVPP